MSCQHLESFVMAMFFPSSCLDLHKSYREPCGRLWVGRDSDLEHAMCGTATYLALPLSDSTARIFSWEYVRNRVVFSEGNYITSQMITRESISQDGICFTFCSTLWENPCRLHLKLYKYMLPSIWNPKGFAPCLQYSPYSALWEQSAY